MGLTAKKVESTCIVTNFFAIFVEKLGSKCHCEAIFIDFAAKYVNIGLKQFICY